MGRDSQVLAWAYGQLDQKSLEQHYEEESGSVDRK